MNITNMALTCIAAVVAMGSMVPGQAVSAELPNPALSQQVNAHLAAGEIGAAADLAAMQSGSSQAALMGRVARAAAGQSAISGSKNPALNGGADFTELMALIQTATDGPWFDVDAEGGTMSPFTSGIKVNPNGVLVRESREEASGRLASLGGQARVAALNEEMARSSSLRLVSLTRLEREVSRRLAEGKPVVESMRQLAGLSQIQYVFVYPESGEIVLGGPAEGWRYNSQGQAIGLESGRPTLQLDDMVTVLRTFGPAGQGVFGCSIDPKQENLKAVKAFVEQSQSRGPLSPAGVKSWGNKIGDLLGLQDISVFGVPASSRIARVMVEADYRMKLIGIGKLNAGSNIPDYFQLLAKDPSLASSSLDALRWWMVMKYEAVLHSADHNAFEIRGSAVQCQSENQFLSENGQRIATGKAEPLNQLFAANFTRHYQELAQKDPIFADLQGIFDLALVAALIQREQLDEKAGWNRGSFAVGGAFLPATYAVPQQTESVVNHRVYNGRDVVLQVAGGVRAEVAAVLDDARLNQESPRLGGMAQTAKAPELPAGRWWWDAR